MSEIALLSDYCLDTTILSNIYIDEYMASNNEAQVKIYLYLLRNLGSGKGVSVVSIADFFNYTVMDVERALFYMQKQGLMKLEEDDGKIIGIRMLPLKKKDIIVFNKKPECSENDLKEFVKRPEVMDLLFVAEQYMGKPLSNEDIKNLYYIKNDLGFSEELIDFLMEFCIDQKKKSFSYMAKVAKDWADSEIKTVEDAKEYTSKCPKEMANVFKAFGIKGLNRKPQQKEVNYLLKWLNEYNFNLSIIEKACIRTVEKTHTVSFEYADAILRDWKNNNVNTVNDIEKLDEEFLNKKQPLREVSLSDSVKAKKNKSQKSGTTFSDFSQREYDFSELERMISEN